MKVVGHAGSGVVEVNGNTCQVGLELGPATFAQNIIPVKSSIYDIGETVESSANTN